MAETPCTPRELIRFQAAQFLAAGIPDPVEDAALLLAHVTGRDALSLRLDSDTVLTQAQLSACQSLCQRRLERIPLQHLTGVQSFCGRDFLVDSRVLIPRPETELLAELAIHVARQLPCPAVLDLCCGSGCIGITVALEVSGADVCCADLSEDALAVARANAEHLHAKPRLQRSDLFAALGNRHFDIIVSNPPYIPSAECLTLQEEVLREPVMALDGGTDGLDFYRKIAAEAPRRLSPGGTLLLEVGWNQAEDVRALLLGAGLRQVAIHKDLSGIQRMVEGHLPTQAEG